MRSRKSIRLPGYDYSRDGACFVTICAKAMVDLSQYGESAQAIWNEIPDHFNGVELDAFVVMPDHVHGIIVIRRGPVGAQHAAPVPLGVIVRSFKSAVSKKMNQVRGTEGANVWHRNYYERIARNDGELNRIRKYIAENPVGRDDASIARAYE